jgi:hypothetical protein
VSGLCTNKKFGTHYQKIVAVGTHQRVKPLSVHMDGILLRMAISKHFCPREVAVRKATKTVDGGAAVF